MQPNVPIATDNLYKFVALFGLVLVVASFAGFYLSYANHRAEMALIEDRRFDLAKSAGTLSPAAVAKIEWDLMIREDVSSANRVTFGSVMAFPLFAGFALSTVGFFLWIKVQRLQDELLELQIAKARKEAHGSNVYRELPERPKPKKAAKKAK